MTPVADVATVVAEAPDMGVPLRLAIVAIAGGAGCAMRVLARDALERRGGQPWRSICAINLAGALAMGEAVAGIRQVLDEAATVGDGHDLQAAADPEQG